MSQSPPKQYFLQHQQMDYEIQCALGGCHYGSADAGEILATADRIQAGDCESWYQAWLSTATRVHGFADQSARAGQPVSARHAYLRAASYYAAAVAMIDGTPDPTRREPTWKQHLACWDAFCARLQPAAEKVSISFENIPMPGYFFKPAIGRGPWPVIIFNNGSDGPTSCMWGCGVAGALERGYAALVFDGPGQNAMLWLHNVPFRHNWETVITPVVDHLLARGDVRPDRIALSGISQGGYWVLRALAFEHRIAAGILDPGVMDVFRAMAGRFPPEILDLLAAGKEEELNAWMEEGLRQAGPMALQEVRWRMRPYCTSSYYQWLKQAQQYNAREVVGNIRCPMFIADPEDEQYWPGQSQEVFDALACPKILVPFTAAEGANWHCEPKARGLYDQRLFDWLATVMPAV